MVFLGNIILPIIYKNNVFSRIFFLRFQQSDRQLFSHQSIFHFLHKIIYIHVDNILCMYSCQIIIIYNTVYGSACAANDECWSESELRRFDNITSDAWYGSRRILDAVSMLEPRSVDQSNILWCWSGQTTLLSKWILIII